MSKTLKKTNDSVPKMNNMRWTDDMDDFLLNVMLEDKTMEIGSIKHGVLVLIQRCIKSILHHSFMQLRKVTSRIASKL